MLNDAPIHDASTHDTRPRDLETSAQDRSADRARTFSVAPMMDWIET